MKEAETEVMKPWKLRSSQRHQKLEEAGMDSLLEASGEYTALPMREHICQLQTSGLQNS